MRQRSILFKCSLFYLYNYVYIILWTSVFCILYLWWLIFFCVLMNVIFCGMVGLLCWACKLTQISNKKVIFFVNAFFLWIQASTVDPCIKCLGTHFVCGVLLLTWHHHHRGFNLTIDVYPRFSFQRFHAFPYFSRIYMNDVKRRENYLIYIIIHKRFVLFYIK